MRAKDFILEGGWVDVRTQSTHITPALVHQVVVFLKEFELKFNQYLKTHKQLPIEIGDPCGSTTYYKRDLIQDPAREYGDIDVNFYLPDLKIPQAQLSSLYKNAIIDFCKTQKHVDSTTGTNLIANIAGQWIQIDLVMSTVNSKEWVKVLAPEWKVKGVLSGSLLSAFAQALNLSFGGTGIQAKTVQGKLVPFRYGKGTSTVNISSNPNKWALDVVKFFGVGFYPPELVKNAGLKDEQRIGDIVKSIRAIAETLDEFEKLNTDILPYASAQELLQKIANIYLDKINKVISSSKFDKAATPAAIEKATKTKKLLAAKSQEVASLLIK